MAYLLRFDGVDDYVEGSIDSTFLTADSLSVELDVLYNDPSQSDEKIYAITSDTDILIGPQTSGETRAFIRARGRGNTSLFTPSLNSNQRYKIGLNIDFLSGDVELLLDGVVVDSDILTGLIGQNRGTQRFIGAEDPSRGYAEFDLYGVKEFLNGNQVSYYNKQTLNGSNDTTLPDTVGGNDGTLVNFPTDNSQWVFFDDGGGAVTVDGATTLPSLTATGNASATLPQPSLSASINLTQLSATGSASATLPQPDASSSIVFNAPTVAGSASATLPQPTLQAAITLPVVTANGNASATLPGFNLSASVNIPTLTATGAAQATLPQPVVSASITMPSLTALGAAEATEPSFTVSGNVTLQPPTVAGSVSATLPQPSISGNIALPSIQASGFIIGGEIVITVEPETNINEPQLSVNINEPQLSTNINGPKLSTNITE